MTDMIPPRTVGITHLDFSDSYVFVREDGSVEIRAGLSSMLLHPNGTIVINANSVKIIAEDLEWNDSTFNIAADNQRQPALIKAKGMLPSERSLLDYNG